MDDILVFGETQSQIVQVSASGPFSEDFLVQVTLNEKKCKLSLPEVKFLGQIINKSGVSPDPEKVKAIHARTNRRQRGATISQNGHFSNGLTANLAETTKPMSSSEQEERLDMGREQQKTLTQIKDNLTSAPALTLYEVQRNNCLSRFILV